MLGKVLVLSASAGAGHIRAADAIEKALHARGLASDVQNVDVLKYTNQVFRHLYSRAYLDLVNKAPEVLGWLYDRLDTPGKNENIRLAFDRFNTGPFVKLLDTYRPDVAICTHFLPSEIIGWLKRKGRVDIVNAVIVTDFDVHAMWLNRGSDHYFVALEETREHLVALGVPGEAVTISGIPIDPVFSERKDPRSMRRKHGLEEGPFTILVSAGGFGVGPVEHIIEALGRLPSRAQAVVVCGRNEELKKKLAAAVRRLGPANVTFHLVGFTTEMDELMTAADLFVGKPGGLTTSESLAKGLPMVVINPIPGQEERNSDHLLEEGIAIRCNNLPTLPYKIDRLIRDPGKLHLMRANALALARPHAAFTVVEALDALNAGRPSSAPSAATPKRRRRKLVL
ncbi:MurG-like transferase [Aquisphaera giovannonii]|uniref:MurG-like transferase n=1 Tax=Aquisphaera giovannonii TaxID=406548 RepID=A0A5B9WDY3_9BACT|nr:glycosyltransferase [Aquisphaera giovannonii]QEH38878.1 MurG-like transferase [Aquisphaera giovannonii]